MGEELVADALDLLCAASLAVVDGLIAPAPDTTEAPEAPSYREARLLFDDAWRLMLTTHGGTKAVVLDTRRETSPGLSLWHLRACIPALECES